MSSRAASQVKSAVPHRKGSALAAKLPGAGHLAAPEPDTAAMLRDLRTEGEALSARVKQLLHRYN